MIKFYLAGPISGRKMSDYVYQFWRMERMLELDAKYKDIEIKVFNPVTRFMKYQGTYEQMMDECFKLIDEADAVVFLKDWQKSRGANMEYGYAVAKGKVILYEEL
jgi:nucleoside 2-deoxyribosyltransferase